MDYERFYTPERVRGLLAEYEVLLDRMSGERVRVRGGEPAYRVAEERVCIHADLARALRALWRRNARMAVLVGLANGLVVRGGEVRALVGGTARGRLNGEQLERVVAGWYPPGVRTTRARRRALVARMLETGIATMAWELGFRG